MNLTDGFNQLTIVSNEVEIVSDLLKRQFPYLQLSNTIKASEIQVNILNLTNYDKLENATYTICHGPGEEIGIIYEQAKDFYFPTFRIKDSEGYFFLVSTPSVIDIHFLPDTLRNWNLLWLGRIIRNVLDLLFIAKGGIFLHGAAVSSDKYGIIFLGDKGKGKTTTTLASCTRGFNFVANDKVGLIRNENGQLTIKGESKSINLALGTVLTDHNLKSLTSFFHISENCIGEYSQKIRVPLIEVQHRLGIKLIHMAVLTHIVLPDIKNQYNIKPISKEAVFEAFADNILEDINSIENNWLHLSPISEKKTANFNLSSLGHILGFTIGRNGCQNLKNLLP